jgi:type VI secretion system secreted protein Hcp
MPRGPCSDRVSRCSVCSAQTGANHGVRCLHEDRESNDADHKEWIEVLSYAHGISQPAGGSRSVGGPGEVARCHFSDFSVVKALDKASPTLQQFTSKGTEIKVIKIELCRPSAQTGAKFKFAEYIMEKVHFTALRPGGTPRDDKPLEELSMSYKKITTTYFEPDPNSRADAGPRTSVRREGAALAASNGHARPSRRMAPSALSRALRSTSSTSFRVEAG